MSQEEYPGTWEDVSTDENYETKRLLVPGGWIVAIRDTSNNDTNILFISDNAHHWKIET